ncbi:ZIP family zinc transporter [Sphaerisporangium flaviroseum]|uniref:ZIP family zinc transporter n=1 Tax=Sphaerisporangium flaviroseum TaxID=509199 RepID=A0ABP7I4N9_9ACTN
MPQWLQAGLWGLLAGGALVAGAAVAWLVRVPARMIAAIMAFGAGVLISALSFELIDEAEQSGGLGAAATGFLAGAVLYVAANAWLARHGARHRKRSGDQQAGERQQEGNGAAIAIGALLDGIPESVVLGLSLLHGSGVGVAVLAAVFISNVPEGLSSASGMKKAGRDARYVFGVWSGIALAGGIAAAIGNLTLGAASPAVIAIITAVAAGAILAMVADTMIPEAFEQAHLLTGLITTLGFLTAFTIERLGD